MGQIKRPRPDAARSPARLSGRSIALVVAAATVLAALPAASRSPYFLFALPLVGTAIAAPRCLAIARRSANPLLWWICALAAVLGGAASALAVASVFVEGLAMAAFYVGAGTSLCFLAGLAPLLRRTLPGAPMERLVDALLFDAVVIALGVWFVILPGLEHRDVVLTLVFAVDLLALALAALATAVANDRSDRHTGWWLTGVCGAAAVGDGFLSVGGTSVTFTAICWMMSSIALAAAASDRTHDTRSVEEDSEAFAFVAASIVVPLLGVLTFPVAAAVLGASGRLDRAGAIYFSSFFVLTLALAFGRQTYLLLDNRRAVARERRLHSEVVRRNEELEALTELAATLTETLEEGPVVERGMAALRIAARASSMALHVPGGKGLELQAWVGMWSSDEPWVTRDPSGTWRPGVSSADGREVVRLPVASRGSQIGLITLVRREGDPVSDADMSLMRLLVDQLAIAVQNARDYSNRLEQAIRDPLTGLYNRRFFYEAFANELQRGERYGGNASIVLIDVDDFKLVNDTLGHTSGDAVLCEVGRLAAGAIRASDQFARVGGEEFALLLPETSQLDALIVAERVRRAVASSPILPDRTVTVSAGIATWPDDATSLEDLEAKADGALYWAKRNGKNLCAVATEIVVSEEGDERDGMLPHLHALVATIDSQHLNTRDHSQNVAAYAAAIGEHLGLSRERIVLLRRAALFHDIGKVAVRGDVLNKPGRLTPAEFEEMQVHPVVGGAMLAHSGFADEADWIRHHHERLDGRGYPDGLEGAEIPLEARIIFVADSFEAMTSDRPYHQGIPVEEAVAELRRCAGSQFEPRLVEALVELLEGDRLPVLALRNSA